MDDFGPRLRHLRVRHGLTQSDLASASGLGQSTISSLENGRQLPWPSTRRSLARALRLSVEGFDDAIERQSIFEASAALPPPEVGESSATTTFASGKIMELLESLGACEAALESARETQRAVALGWSTDRALQVLAASGSEYRTPLQRGTSLTALLGVREIPDAVTAALAGNPGMTRLQRPAGEYLLIADPRHGTDGAVAGTTGVLIALKSRPWPNDRAR